jgi:hypothetical protein
MSTHPITFGFDPDAGVTIDRSPTVLTYGATLQYSLLYMNSFVHEVPEFFRNLIPTFEAVFSTPVSNIGPSVPLSIPGTHETTGVYGPGLYYIGRLGPVTFQLGAVAAIPINRASGRHVGALAILDIFLDDTLPDSLGKPLFGPRQPRSAGCIKEAAMQRFVKLLLAAALAAPLAATAAFAHAFLDHGVPGVGMTVSGPVRDLRLYYTQGVVTAFSAVSVTSSTGAAIPASKPVNDPLDQ